MITMVIATAALVLHLLCCIAVVDSGGDGKIKDSAYLGHYRLFPAVLGRLGRRPCTGTGRRRAGAKAHLHGRSRICERHIPKRDGA